MSQQILSKQMSIQNQSSDEQTTQQSIQQEDTSVSQSVNMSAHIAENRDQNPLTNPDSGLGMVSIPSTVTPDAGLGLVSILSSVPQEQLQETSSPPSHQTTESKHVNFNNIGLDVVSFSRTFCRNRGTLSQMVKSFEDMAERLSDPLNEYQKGLYPHIQSECKKIVESYSHLLSTISPDDNYVIGFYVNGPSNDGKRKATATAHEQKSYGVSEYKETLKSTNDRLRHIKIDCQRKLKENTRENHPVFQRMIDFCDTFHQTVNVHLIAWDTFIAQFRQNNNINHPHADMVRRASRTDRVKRSEYVKKSDRVRLTQNTNQSTNTNQGHSNVLPEEKQQIETTDIVLSTVNDRTRTRIRAKGSGNQSTLNDQNVKRLRKRAPYGSQNIAQSQSDPEIKSDTQIRVTKRVLLKNVNTHPSDVNKTPRSRKLFRDEEPATNPIPIVDVNSVKIVRPKKNASKKHFVNQRVKVSDVQEKTPDVQNKTTECNAVA